MEPLYELIAPPKMLCAVTGSASYCPMFQSSFHWAAFFGVRPFASICGLDHRPVNFPVFEFTPPEVVASSQWPRNGARLAGSASRFPTMLNWNGFFTMPVHLRMLPVLSAFCTPV